MLTDPTYYIEPSLEECDQLTNEGTCFVENFIIGRKGMGRIHFPGTTNVYRLNLDKIGESAHDRSATHSDGCGQDGCGQDGCTHFSAHTSIHTFQWSCDCHVIVVNIGVREVVVYPDDLPGPTPIEGEELNKRAFISLEGFWPKDKTTGDFIRDEDRLNSMNYSLKLKRIVAKIGGEFIEYQPDTGTCVFQVKGLVAQWLQGI